MKILTFKYGILRKISVLPLLALLAIMLFPLCGFAQNSTGKTDSTDKTNINPVQGVITPDGNNNTQIKINTQINKWYRRKSENGE